MPAPRRAHLRAFAARLAEFSGDLFGHSDHNREQPRGEGRKFKSYLRGYVDRDADADGREATLVSPHTVRSALRAGETIHRGARRTASLAKDVASAVRGGPREKDAYGREKKREYEKEWFKRAAGKVVIGGAILGGAYAARNTTAGRRVYDRIGKKVAAVGGYFR